MRLSVSCECPCVLGSCLTGRARCVFQGDCATGLASRSWAVSDRKLAETEWRVLRRSIAYLAVGSHD